MIRVILGGRLGNVLFEYAAGRHLALRNQVPLQLILVNHLALRDPAARRLVRNLRCFKLRTSFSRSWPVKLGTYLGRRCERWYPGCYRERGLIGYDPQVLQLGKDAVLSGLFQSYRYFEEIAPLIRGDLALDGLPASPAFRLLKEEIERSCSVAVHVRRGDYLHSPLLAVGGPDYYAKAVSYLQERLERPRFFVFSDDLAWCRRHLPIADAVFVDLPEARALPVVDLELMRSCRHQIIANSTFSWWGAWLNPHAGKQVVAPRRWFTDEGLNRQAQTELLHEAWVRIGD